MFLFSIIPLYLTPGDQVHNPSSETEKVENKIKLLEALLTGECLGQAVDIDPDTLGIQQADPKYYTNGHINTKVVVKELQETREEELKLIQNNGIGSSIDSTMPRLSEISAKLSVSTQRLRDLNGLKYAIEHGETFDADPSIPGVQEVSGIGNTHDINLVNQEIYRTEIYEAILKDAQKFWTKVTGNITDGSDTLMPQEN